MDIIKHTSRKFIVTLLMILLSTALLITGMMNERSWVELIEVVVCTYLGVNVASKGLSQAMKKSEP